MNQGSQPAATPTSTAPARQSRRVSHQPRHTSRVMIDVHQIAGGPMASTSDAFPAPQTGSGAVGHQEEDHGRLITSHVQGSDWYGWCACSPVLNASIALLYWNSEISGEITGRFTPCC